MSGEFWGTLIIQLIVAVYAYGRLAERVKGHGERLEKAETKLGDHDERIGHLEGRRLR